MTDYIAELRRLVGHRPLLLAAAGVVVRDEDGRILLQHRTDDDRWGYPGGALELGEAFEQAARRELHEETGLTAGRLELIDTYSGPEFFVRYANGDEAYVVGATFLAREVDGVPRADGAEGLELGYFPLDALPDLNAFNAALLDHCRAHLE